MLSIFFSFLVSHKPYQTRPQRHRAQVPSSQVTIVLRLINNRECPGRSRPVTPYSVSLEDLGLTELIAHIIEEFQYIHQYGYCRIHVKVFGLKCRRNKSIVLPVVEHFEKKPQSRTYCMCQT